MTPLRQGPQELGAGLLLMLDGNVTLQKLISTWPNAYISKAKKQEQIVKWSTLTGLREIEVAAAWDTIFENGFCTREGKVHEYAARYLASMAMSKLPASVRKPQPAPVPPAGGAK